MYSVGSEVWAGITPIDLRGGSWGAGTELSVGTGVPLLWISSVLGDRPRDANGIQSLGWHLGGELKVQGLPLGLGCSPSTRVGFGTGGEVPSLSRVQGVQGRVDRTADDCMLRRGLGPGWTIPGHPVFPVPRMRGAPPTCRLSAHGCGGGGGGGGSSGLRKTCWPRLRNWTTAMRMWCSTKTMLAAARPPAPPARQLRSVSASATASPGPRECPPQPRPGPPPARPRPPQPRPLPRRRGQHRSAVGSSDPQDPRRLSPPLLASPLPRLFQPVHSQDPHLEPAAAFAALPLSHTTPLAVSQGSLPRPPHPG
jgi:hypothetical protein